MYAAYVLTGLIATVSAIDVYGYRNNEKCQGGDYVMCQNVNPGDCCVRASGNVFRSIGFRAIPTNWRINGNGFTGGDCRNVHYVAASNGAENVCAGGSLYSGGNYNFAGKKRSDAAEEACPAAGGCGSVHRGDVMVFEGGAKYDLANLDDASFDEMVSGIPCPMTIFENGGNATDIPAKFDEYKAE